MRGKRKQWEWLAITAAAALAVGLLLSPFAARLLPVGWDAAAVAATIMHADRWNAGQALMKSSNPGGWQTLAAEMNLAVANHDVLTACREAAQRIKKEQHCAIVVPAPAGDPKIAPGYTTVRSRQVSQPALPGVNIVTQL